TSGLYAFIISPRSVVVVVFPFVPVIASTSPFPKQLASSTSPQTGIPAFSISCTTGRSVGTPGLSTSIPISSTLSYGNAPITISVLHPSGRRPATSSLLSFSFPSYKIVSTPSCSSSVTAPIPLFPEPNTSTFFPLPSNIFFPSFLVLQCQQRNQT